MINKILRKFLSHTANIKILVCFKKKDAQHTNIKIRKFLRGQKKTIKLKKAETNIDVFVPEVSAIPRRPRHWTPTGLRTHGSEGTVRVRPWERTVWNLHLKTEPTKWCRWTRQWQQDDGRVCTYFRLDCGWKISKSFLKLKPV